MLQNSSMHTAMQPLHPSAAHLGLLYGLQIPFLRLLLVPLRLFQRLEGCRVGPGGHTRCSPDCGPFDDDTRSGGSWVRGRDWLQSRNRSWSWSCSWRRVGVQAAHQLLGHLQVVRADFDLLGLDRQLSLWSCYISRLCLDFRLHARPQGSPSDLQLQLEPCPSRGGAGCPRGG